MLKRLAGALAPDGALLLGAAETVLGLTGALSSHPDHRGLYVKAAPGLALPETQRMVATR